MYRAPRPPHPTKSDNPYGPYGDKRRGDSNAGPAPNINACDPGTSSSDADTGSDGSGNYKNSTAGGLDVPGAIFTRCGTVPTVTDVFGTYVPPQSPISDFGSSHETTSGGRGRSITGFGGPYEDAVREHERNRPAPTIPHITTTALQCGDSITGSDHRDGSATPERGDWTADEGPSEPVLAGWSLFSSSQEFTSRGRGDAIHSVSPLGRSPTIWEKDTKEWC